MFRLLRSAILASFALAILAIPLRTRVVAQTPAVQLPAIPNPVPVQLEAGTTAFLALDFENRFCAPDPACLATLPAVQSGLAAARSAGALVVYSNIGAAAQGGDPILSDVAPASGDPIVYAPVDKFFNTDLDQILRQAGIKTAVVVGTYANGAVLYTAMALNIRGYTAVVAEDAVSSPDDFDTWLARYQLLHQPSIWNNAQNVPLKPNSVTLSRTNLISYR